MEYLILDFGNVLAYPTTGNWHITPKFLELIDMNKINKEQLKENIKKYQYLIDCSLDIKTLQEEFTTMKSFYENVLKGIYNEYSDKLIEEIAYNRVYEFDKYELYEDVYDELNRLSKKYKIILLSDNWPSLLEYMKYKKIECFFEKIYISSMYSLKKENGEFFDLVLKEFNVKDNSIFVDDHEENLTIAEEKGIHGLLMDRKCSYFDSKFKIINSLKDII